MLVWAFNPEHRQLEAERPDHTAFILAERGGQVYLGKVNHLNEFVWALRFGSMTKALEAAELISSNESIVRIQSVA